MFFNRSRLEKIRPLAIQSLLWLLAAARAVLKWSGRVVAKGVVIFFRPVASFSIFVLNPLMRLYWRMVRFSRASGLFLSQYFSYIIVAGALFFGVTGNILAEEEKIVHETTSRLFESLLSDYDQDILITEEGLVIREQEIITNYLTDQGLLRSEIGAPISIAEEKLVFELPQTSVFEDNYLRPTFEGVGGTRQAVQQYVVRSGDTISSIAERFGISIYTILWANKLTLRSILREGQTINILPVSGVAHKILRGDTVTTLAKKYNAEADKIISFNQLAYDQTLTVGEIIIIPGGEITAPPPPPRPIITPLRNVFTAPQNLPPTTGKFLWPVPVSHRITQYWGRRHTGVDIGANYLTPIIAVADGIVELVQFGRTGYGYQVIIDHENGYRTRYGHQSQIFVKPGERVTRGQTIGTIGSTGRSTGPHLHFEIYINARRVNPLSYIR